MLGGLYDGVLKLVSGAQSNSPKRKAAALQVTPKAKKRAPASAPESTSKDFDKSLELYHRILGCYQCEGTIRAEVVAFDRNRKRFILSEEKEEITKDELIDAVMNSVTFLKGKLGGSGAGISATNTREFDGLVLCWEGKKHTVIENTNNTRRTESREATISFVDAKQGAIKWVEQGTNRRDWEETFEIIIQINKKYLLVKDESAGKFLYDVANVFFNRSNYLFEPKAWADAGCVNEERPHQRFRTSDCLVKPLCFGAQVSFVGLRNADDGRNKENKIKDDAEKKAEQNRPVRRADSSAVTIPAVQSCVFSAGGPFVPRSVGRSHRVTPSRQYELTPKGGTVVGISGRDKPCVQESGGVPKLFGF